MKDSIRYSRLKQLIEDGKADRFYGWPIWHRVRDQVLRYDHYECQICKSKGRYRGAKIVHHVKHTEYVFRSHGTGYYAGFCHIFYRPDRGMADQLYGRIHAAEAEQRIRTVSADRSEKERTVPAVSEGKPSDRHGGSHFRNRGGNPAAADHHDGVLFRVQRGLSFAHPDERLVPSHDGGMLLRLLSVRSDAQ